jgi:hypothetical protein
MTRFYSSTIAAWPVHSTSRLLFINSLHALAVLFFVSPGPIALYVPRFRPHRITRLTERDKAYTVDEPARGQTSSRERASLPANVLERVESADLQSAGHQTASVDDGASSSAEERVILLTDESASAAGVMPQTSQKGRGPLRRQDDLKPDV